MNVLSFELFQFFYHYTLEHNNIQLTAVVMVSHFSCLINYVYAIEGQIWDWCWKHICLSAILWMERKSLIVSIYGSSLFRLECCPCEFRWLISQLLLTSCVGPECDYVAVTMKGRNKLVFHRIQCQTFYSY